MCNFVIPDRILANTYTLVMLQLLLLATYAAGLATAQDWESLNASVDGRLRSARPIASSCYGNFQGHRQAKNMVACDAIQANYSSALFRQRYFGAYEHSQGEACFSNPIDQCLLDYENPLNLAAIANISCNQGVVPPYFVAVRDHADVEAVLSFVRRTNVALAIKNTGHDYQSRSSAKGSLAIWMVLLKNMTYSASYQPEGCHTASPQKAITMGSGVNFDEIYRFADINNVTYVGGSSPGVGGSGGWVLGGGHSVLSPKYGLGVDRVLEFKLVTADGKLRTANECQNTDLFWALKGGGAGAYGVVLESTSRVEPTLKLSVVNIVMPKSANIKPWLEIIINSTAQWAAHAWGGYHGPTALSKVTPLLNLDEAKTSMKELVQYAESNNGTVSFNSLPSWYSFYSKYVSPAGNIGVGEFNFPDSRVLPMRLFQNEVGKTAVLDHVLDLVRTGDTPSVLTVTPTIFNDGTAPGDSAVPAAWYTGAWLLTTSTVVAWNSTFEERRGAVAHLRQLSASKEKLAPDGCTYVNEASPWLSDWKEAYWGGNYARLLEIKNKYDPGMIFSCWRCVGWEEDDDMNKCMSKAAM